MILKYALFVSIFIYRVICRDFYVGMFKKNDYLVAQDSLYKEKVPYKYTYAKYGRLFKCPITYIRVVDRLGVGNGPKVEVTRGGLRYKYLVFRLRSPYNLPISVNIYIGCENKMTTKKTKDSWVSTASSRASFSSETNKTKIGNNRADLNEFTTYTDISNTGSSISPTIL